MKNKLLRNKKNEKGLSGVDIVIAMALIVIFVPLITTLFVNVYLNWMTTKRNTMANAYATQIIEKAQAMYFEDLNEQSIRNYINSLNIPNGYEIGEAPIVNSYKDEEEPKLVKTITVSISYKVGKNTENITMRTVKTKEILITPNIPELERNMLPVKSIGNSEDLQITSKNDSLWYSYENKKWAKTVLTDETSVENIDDISEEDLEMLLGKKIITTGGIYIWIPRFAYVENDIKFLYSNTNKYVENNNVVQEFTAHDAFGNDTGFWIRKTETGYETESNEEKEAVELLLNSKYGEK